MMVCAYCTAKYRMVSACGGLLMNLQAIFLQFKLFTLIQTLWLDNTELLPVLLFVVPGDIAHLSELAELQVEDLTILLICELSPTLWHEYLDTGPEILES